MDYLCPKCGHTGRISNSGLALTDGELLVVRMAMNAFLDDTGKRSVRSQIIDAAEAGRATEHAKMLMGRLDSEMLCRFAASVKYSDLPPGVVDLTGSAPPATPPA